MKFRIYYEDGSVYDGETTEDAMNAPTMGPLVVKQEAPSNANGFSLMCCAFFTWHKKYGVWCGADDQYGLSRYWATEKGAQKVLQGQWVPDKVFQDARARAVDDEYLETPGYRVRRR